jgi:hypothetical protein
MAASQAATEAGDAGSASTPRSVSAPAFEDAPAALVGPPRGLASARRWRAARKSYQNSIMASLQNDHSFFIIDNTIAVSPVAAHN